MTTVILNQPAGLHEVPGAVIPPPGPDGTVIKNTFFFPDVDPLRVRKIVRLEQTVSDERLRDAIKSGIAEVNAELYDWREQQIAAGFRLLADVPADQLDGESVRCFHYLRAVCAMTAATLAERYRGADASAKGDKKADSVETTVDDLWRDMRWSLSRLQDKSRCIVGQL